MLYRFNLLTAVIIAVLLQGFNVNLPEQPYKDLKPNTMRYTKFYAPMPSEAEVAIPILPEQAIENRFEKGELLTDTTRDLIDLVNNAGKLVETKGEAAFQDFNVQGSRWRLGDQYVFVIDLDGNMMVHPELSGNQMNLQDINGKKIIKGLIQTASLNPKKTYGWYHYEWKTPDGLLPRWKSSYVKLIAAPSGKKYVIGSGVYNDRMEKEFVVDNVVDAVSAIEKDSKKAFEKFHDPKDQFLVKDAYIFVIDEAGIELVNPALPTLEGRNIMDIKDSKGKQFVKEMWKLVNSKGKGWVEYMWPKPGENVSTQKSTYVTKAKMDDKWVMVGCGVYLADAPKTVATQKKSATELMTMVRDAARLLQEQGENAYPEFRKTGTKWLQGDTYVFVWSLDGIRVFNAAKRETEGQNVVAIKDILGRPVGKMFLDAAASINGEGWVHYMEPEPGSIFPTWKSSFVKRVTFPSGKQYLVGSGIYNMQMDRAFIEDVVNRAAALVQQNGKDAFSQLRDKHGEFYFMDTYVFVDDVDGTELVNPAQPALEGMNLLNLKDAHGKYIAREYIPEAVKNGAAWVDYYWYKPGDNTPAHKFSYVKKVEVGKDVFIVGAGFYLPAEE